MITLDALTRALKGCVAAALLSGLGASSAPAASIEFLNQGPDWTNRERRDFYTRDQGSRLIPLRWILSLKLPNGEPFMGDQLARYGYLQRGLPNDDGAVQGLPVGFVVVNEGGAQTLGLTCSACHTRQIDVGAKSYRVDGGPSMADLGAFWSDLDVAVQKILDDQPAFDEFAASVLGPNPPPDQKAKLHDEVAAWQRPAHAIAKNGLPAKPWGPGRLDAVGMILNRVNGLDIGTTPDHVIEENIAHADAPVRPPFLWNAPRQDFTQWPGFAQNGDWLLGLARNLGEVYGVFGKFHPRKDPTHLLGVNYLAENTGNFEGLLALEELISRIGPPKWPWKVDTALAKRGDELFKRECASCHEIAKGQPRVFNWDTWRTPIQDVGTDAREYAGLKRTAKTGVLEGAGILLIQPPLQPVDSAVSVLALSVRGAILQHSLPITLTPLQRLQQDVIAATLAPQIKALRDLYQPLEEKRSAAPAIKYEARVMEGVWAAAPYLHNGSVPTLAELLKPVAERVKAFKRGPAYDADAVGLAVEQSKFSGMMETGCADPAKDRNSGDSNCGHEFGVTLAPEDKKALIEYMKTL